ncbi:hypothetical protein [Pseudonocardia sp. KRD291]|nr:hypothetical protein [Pseudonocardia sp. KRD291]MBW0106787.1 hypothetical protein [Pseudonocardia sp. KRD291]
MTASPSTATVNRCPGSAADPAVSWHLDRYLECFWPSRRIDEFDGLCPGS